MQTTTSLSWHLLLIGLIVGGVKSQLSCISCEAGLYLDASNASYPICRPCPVTTTTSDDHNASDPLHCECETGRFNESSICEPCEIGFYKPLLGNASCNICPGGAHTVAAGSVHIAECLCEPGSTLAPYRLDLTSSDMSNGNIIVLARGGVSIVTAPSGHYFHVSTVNSHTAWVETHNYEGMTSNGDGTVATVVIPDDYTQQLYYKCMPHSNMFGRIELDSSLVQCELCAAGSFKNESGDQACLPCPVGSFCPEGAITPTLCPSESTSNTGGESAADCFCVPGFVNVRTSGTSGHNLLSQCDPCPVGQFNPVYDVTECQLCPADTFLTATASTAESDCQPCTNESFSSEGSDAHTDCLCNSGYEGVPGGPCEACSPGFYRDITEDNTTDICEACPGGTYNALVAASARVLCLACPTATDSASGSGSLSSCVCDPGFFAADRSSLHDCAACGNGTFQPSANSSACELCPAGKFSEHLAAVSSDVCQQCVDGFYNTVLGSSACAPCPGNTWQNLSRTSTHAFVCSSCPANSQHALEAQTDIEACRCDAGFAEYDTGSSSYHCKPCLAGHYCPGDGAQILCPVNQFALEGSTQCTQCSSNSRGGQIVGEEECLCLIGHEGESNSDCTPCQVGKFQPLNLTFNSTCSECAAGSYVDFEGAEECLICPGNASSPPGSSAINQCGCSPGFFGPNGGTCVQCQADRFCPGGTSDQPCRAFSTSPPGSDAQEDCSCRPGFFSDNTTSSCRKCLPGSYCSGGLHIAGCSSNSDSVPGSDAIEDCHCVAGMWRGCALLINGTEMNEAGACTIDYTLPCFGCGIDTVCVNNTVLHCPEFSEADPASSHPDDCVCEHGYRRVDSDSHS